ncbi:MAG: cellulase family glycosylhydrolase [Gammaproteobacteria bacterium]
MKKKSIYAAIFAALVVVGYTSYAEADAWGQTRFREELVQNITKSQAQSVPSLSSLSVSGNKIVNEQGQQVILRGVDRNGPEYMCVGEYGSTGIFDGPTDTASVQAMKNWGINAVLIPLNETCWLGINGVNSAYSGTNYRQAVINYVKLLESYNIYPIISYMWGAPGTQQAREHPAMPNADHAPTFWTSVANTFKDDKAVIFRLQQEPHPNNSADNTAAWQCWKNGGSSCNEGYAVVGFQSLVNTVRATGAQNVLALSGVDWANGMTQFLTYKPTDPLNNLIATVDVYPNGNTCGSVACYDSQYAPVLAQIPFMAGEFGESVNGNVCSVTASNTLLNWLDQHQSGYMAWVWNSYVQTCGDLELITSYDGTPHSPNGTNYKRHLLNLATTPTPTVPSPNRSK